MNIDNLKFDDKGLIPAIVQDYYTNRVLTLAYMNRESLSISVKEGYTCFYSRSRKELWRKGETSGNTQKIVSITKDCDSDALVVKVIPNGPACHTGTVSCFEEQVFSAENKADFSLDELYNLILNRKREMTEGSYTTYLFKEGEDKMLKKIGEECTEVIIGAKNNDFKETVYEIADLCYHVMVLMAEKSISLNDIRSELESRHVIDKKEKQKNMGAK